MDYVATGNGSDVNPPFFSAARFAFRIPPDSRQAGGHPAGNRQETKLWSLRAFATGSDRNSPTLARESVQSVPPLNGLTEIPPSQPMYVS
ncbi:MAG: hypothetical protein K0B87_02595, partial [Candidatus Syntrophosphaera sp.]|nr:hypothetical protein [Candidatus Syntrophosphaera sp.]